jgi:general stress protein YciG
MSQQQQPPRPRGLAAVAPERRREIARKGGKASRGGFRAMPAKRLREVAAEGARRAHANGNAHEWTSEEARIAGTMGHPPRRATLYRSRAGHIFQPEVIDA